MPGLVAGKLGKAFDQQRQHTDFYMGRDTPGEPVVHGCHFYLSPFERTKAALYDHQPFISESGIFQTDGVIIGFKHPFAVILGGFPDSSAINTDKTAFGYFQISFIPPGRQ